MKNIFYSNETKIESIEPNPKDYALQTLGMSLKLAYSTRIILWGAG